MTLHEAYKRAKNKSRRIIADILICKDATRLKENKHILVPIECGRRNVGDVIDNKHLIVYIVRRKEKNK